MQMRYRYRIEPTPDQQAMLARVFGCARVVFNDAPTLATNSRPLPRTENPLRVSRNDCR
jgi:hypothetical protein